jgi:hypothetical protein
MRLLYIKNFAKLIGLHTHWALDLGPRAYIKSWEDDIPYMCRFRDCKKQRARQTWRKPTGQMAVPRVHSWLHRVFSVFHNCKCRKKTADNSTRLMRRCHVLKADELASFIPELRQEKAWGYRNKPRIQVTVVPCPIAKEDSLWCPGGFLCSIVYW